MKRLLSLVVVLVGACTGLCAEDIRLPSGPPVVVPVTPLAPDAVLTLTQDNIYIVDCDAEYKIFASPEGVVKISTDTGPLRVKGKFVDGTKTETRTFAGKFLYIVEPLQAGKVELIMVGANTVKRRTLNVVTDSVPDPVKPVVDFGAKLRTVYKAAPDPASLAKLLTLLDEVSAQNFKNFDDMESVLAKAGKKYLPNGELQSVRDAISDELVRRCGTNPKQTDVDKAKAVYKEAVTALK